MTFDEFSTSLSSHEPPPGLSPVLRALWLAGKGDWSGAHGVAQDVDTADGAWVHAHLHRQEGDADNARYWYDRAGKKPASNAIAEEWAAMVRALLA